MTIQKKTCRATDKSVNLISQILFNYSVKRDLSQIYEDLGNFQKTLGGENA